LFFFADVMEIMFLTYLKMAFEKDPDVNSWWTAALGTSVFCGMLLGASFWGFFADKYGRKSGLFVVALVISTFGLASVFSPTVEVLVVFRALVGFGLGGSHISVSLLMELVPPANRNTMLAFFQSFVLLGVWAEAGLAWGFMEWLGWKWVAFFTSCPSFLAVILIYWYTNFYLFIHFICFFCFVLFFVFGFWMFWVVAWDSWNGWVGSGRLFTCPNFFAVILFWCCMLVCLFFVCVLFLCPLLCLNSCKKKNQLCCFFVPGFSKTAR